MLPHPVKYQIDKLDQASDSDARKLSEISMASKAHWGYPAEWLELWREDLSVSSAYLAQHHTFALRQLPDRAFLGFCIVSEEHSCLLWVEHLWILPEYIGQGLGSALLHEALTSCSSPEHRSVRVIADPNAAAFYQAKGFVRIDFHPSQPGDRMLPVMEKLLGE